MAWYCSMFNVLFLPLFAFFRMSCFNRQNENITIKKIFVESIHHFIDRGFTTIQFFTRCILFCSLWTLANYLLIYGIRKLDATVSMSLFATSVNFIYFLSWVVLHHQFVGVRVSVCSFRKFTLNTIDEFDQIFFIKTDCSCNHLYNRRLLISLHESY